MDLYIYSKDLVMLGAVDMFTSFIFTKNYHKAGRFELHLSANEKNLDLFKRGNIIYKDSETVGYIETIKLTINKEGKEMMTCVGKALIGYLGQRINWGRIDYNGSTEILMRELIEDSAINPSNPDRKIHNLILGGLQAYNDTINYQNSYGNILDCLENISNTSGLGFRNVLDISEKKVIFETYKGIDRTIGNGLIAPCIFSRDFENILEQEYFESINNYKNTALIAGTGEDEERRTTEIEEGQGLDRHELFVDARDINDQKEVNDEFVDITDNEYLPLLIQRGREKLAEYKQIETFDSKVDLNANKIYKEDFDLGDIVTVVDEKWGLQVDTRITEVTEVYEEKGFDIRVVFGNNIPTLIDKLRQVIN